MATQDMMRDRCEICNGSRVFVRPGTNHMLHLLLTILTAGFWLLIWIGCAVKFGGWKCSECGTKR